MLCRFFLAALLAFAAPAARAWGRLGHEAIGTVAGELLKPKARLAVKKILGNDDLADAGTWLDEVRSAERGTGPLVRNAEAEAFNQKFPDNHEWHFVNLPLDTPAYTVTNRFAELNDVVHQINAAIAVLEGRSGKFTPAQALRVLVHLVGDVHQPLHVGTGYFNLQNPRAPKLVGTPSPRTVKNSDLGGNKVATGSSKFDSLHGYWDTVLVAEVASTGNPEKLAAHLRKNLSPATWRSPGDYHAWAEAWATDSVHEAALVYRGIVFTGTKTSASKALETVEAELPKDYEAKQKPRAQIQLAKAGFHLAELLNALEWKTP